jgi:hypothetical protein
MYVYINESPKKKVASRRGWTSPGPLSGRI